jgi:extradiol dioxygenase family protein
MKTNEINDFHWGFNVSKEEFERLTNKIKETPDLDFEMAPTRKDEGTAIERIKFYLKDPNGHLIEIKHFVNKPI